MVKTEFFFRTENYSTPLKYGISFYNVKLYFTICSRNATIKTAYKRLGYKHCHNVAWNYWGGYMKEIQKIEPIKINEIENLIYSIRGQKVMLDSDLAQIYGYELKRLNEQVKRNSQKFPDDFMFQLTDMESDYLRSQFATTNISSMSRYNPYVFTEQGIYMLMTILKGELAEKQSIALVRIFKQMKDFISDYNKTLVTSDDFLRLATLTSENSSEISHIKDVMLEKKDLDSIIKSFSDKRIPKDYVLLNGQIVEAVLAYSDIYSKAKKTIFIVDNYIGMKHCIC